MDTEEIPKTKSADVKTGRKKKDPSKAKKGRSFSLTDAELKEFDRQAKRAGHVERSSFLVEALNLSKSK